MEAICIQLISAAPAVSSTPEYHTQNVGAGVLYLSLTEIDSLIDCLNNLKRQQHFRAF
ncbi:hypothetical protein HALO59_160027 [Halomonas sp. 59]|nr:hypothetical protein HALO113_160669 [Halomonas sp. 113]CAD5264191.1 hypothetical protein HALO59_160027 [Halomonas sp. 59]CAD5277075.1 hypothetical protein HALOI3_210027 [Halomonas sp. I3]CAD5285966.1 hypothetical protein HALO156_30164 [Halomonas sp. 156]VXB49261.1 hypothetical protein HALO98_170027 [Halomonas titanicae]